MMSYSTALSTRCLAAALLVAGFLPAVATARVGVTSAAEGDPMGKPPAEVERVLRIGIDIQADELVTTQAGDRAHLVFLDGTSITIGANARVKIDRFVYDPNTGVGSLALSASSGVLRLVGGKISKNQAVTINTPASYIGVRGGIAVIEVAASQTRAAFLFGRDMTVAAQGQTQTVSRPGYEVLITTGGMPGRPGPIPPAVLNASISQLEGRSGGRGTASGGSTSGIASKIETGTHSLATATQAAASTSLAQSSTPSAGGTTSPQSAGWQQWGGGVAYTTPAVFNPVAQVPLTGTATYNGSFNATGTSHGSPTTINGSFNMSWNFSSQNGNFSLVSTTPSNPGTASGTLTVSGNGFAGPFTVTGAGSGGYGGSGTLQGSFVSSSSSPVGGVKGTMSGQGGGGNSFSGTFSGSR
jgi:hypothetical protein